MGNNYLNLEEVLDRSDIERSLRITEIVCKNSGEVIKQNLDPTVKWPILAVNALKKPDEFEVVESLILSPVDEMGNIIWDEADLKLKSMPELRKIGVGLSVASNKKDKLISLILEKQRILND